jgi:hypothetical protein
MVMGAPLYKGDMPRSFAAWLVTGPIGHLAAGVADWVELLARWCFARLRGRRRRIDRARDG